MKKFLPSKEKVADILVHAGYMISALCMVVVAFTSTQLTDRASAALSTIVSILFIAMGVFLFFASWAINPFSSIKEPVTVEYFAAPFVAPGGSIVLMIISMIAYGDAFKYTFDRAKLSLILVLIACLILAVLIFVVFKFNRRGYQSMIGEKFSDTRDRMRRDKEWRRDNKARFRSLHPKGAHVRQKYKSFNSDPEFKSRNKEIKWGALKVLIPQTLVLILPVIWALLYSFVPYFKTNMPGWSLIIFILTILASTFGGALMFGLPLFGGVMRKKHFYTYDVDTTLFGDVYSITETKYTYQQQETKFYWDIIFFAPLFAIAGVLRVLGIFIILVFYRPSSRYLMPVPGYIGIKRDSRIIPNWVTMILTIAFGFTFAYDEDKECEVR